MPKISGKKKQAFETKEIITQAMVHLIENSNYSDITIYQLLDEAKVSRRTFYRHFKSKEDLLDYCLERLIMDYYGERDKFLYAKRSEEVFMVTLTFMYQRRKFLRSLIQSGNFDKFSSKFNENSTVIYRTFGLPWSLSSELSSREINYISKVLIGAYLNVLKYWLAEENPVSPETVSKDFTLLFNSIPGYFAKLDDDSKSKLSAQPLSDKPD